MYRIPLASENWSTSIKKRGLKQSPLHTKLYPLRPNLTLYSLVVTVLQTKSLTPLPYDTRTAINITAHHTKTIAPQPYAPLFIHVNEHKTTLFSPKTYLLL